MHTYVGEKAQGRKGKTQGNGIDRCCRNNFGRQRHCTCAVLCEQIQVMLDVKERTAKSYIKFMRKKEVITKITSNVGYFTIGNIQN
jgi:hypothetical protein